MIFNIKLVLFSFVALVAAQGTITVTVPTSGSGATSTPLPSGVTPCILNCVAPAASAAGCSDFTDIQCVCNSDSFHDAAEDCIKANCSKQEQEIADRLEGQGCQAFLGGASGLGSPTGTIGSGGGTGGAAVPTAINSVPGTGTDGTPASVAPASATTSPSSAMSFIIKDNSIWHLAAGVIGVVAAAAL